MRKGWRIHRVWSTDWFKNREAEIRRLWEAVEAARTASNVAPGSKLPTFEKPDQPKQESVSTPKNPEPAKTGQIRSVQKEITSEVWRRLGNWLLSTGHLSLKERGLPPLIADGILNDGDDIRQGREIMRRAMALGFEVSENEEVDLRKSS